MAKVDKYELPDELYYTDDHAWIKVEGNLLRIGITDFMQQMAGEITFIRLPRAGKDMEAGKTLSSLQSGKWAGKVAVPSQAKVVDVNKDLPSNPQTLNQDPYGAGWIAVLEPADFEGTLKQLMQGEQVAAWLKAEIAKHPQ